MRGQHLPVLMHCVESWWSTLAVSPAVEALPLTLPGPVKAPAAAPPDLVDSASVSREWSCDARALTSLTAACDSVHTPSRIRVQQMHHPQVSAQLPGDSLAGGGLLARWIGPVVGACLLPMNACDTSAAGFVHPDATLCDMPDVKLSV